MRLFATLALFPFALFAQEPNRHSWTLPGGDTITGTIESAGARGVLVKREDGHSQLVARKTMKESDRALLDEWLAGSKTPADYAKPDQKIHIKTKQGSLAYDLTNFTAKPGSTVHLILENVEELQHNLIVCSKPDPKVGQALAMKAIELGAEGMNREWIPDSEDILAASRMANPHQTTHLYFRAPEKDGNYAYVCTFPGHSQVMKGIMQIGEPKVSQGSTGGFTLTYKLYHGGWGKLPKFDELKPVEEGPVSGLINVDGFKPKDNFGLVYSGEFNAPTEGEYTFKMSSDDGARLSINEKAVITLDGVHGPGPMQPGKVKLSAGKHRIKIEYFEKGGGQELYISWQGPDLAETFLTSPRKSGGGGSNTAGIPLYPFAGEAMIYRNFIDGVGTARGIGVGYSEGTHLAYDAQNGRLAMMWRGGFIDAKRHWTGRGQGYQAPGEKYVKPDLNQQMMAYLSAPDSAWPTTDLVAKQKSKLYSNPDKKPSQYQFMGYELNAKRQPTFLWRYRDVAVRDFPQPAANGFDRKLTIKRKGSSTEQLYMRFQPTQDVDIAIEGNNTVAAGTEIRVPIEFSNGTAEFTIKYSFK